MVEVGEEYPYEWVEPRRMGVIREYSQGPFRWMVSTVELIPRSTGGTTLIDRLQARAKLMDDPRRLRWGLASACKKPGACLSPD